MSAEARHHTVVAIPLRGFSALCVPALIGLGLLMAHAGSTPMRQFQFCLGHKSLGITVVSLTALRLAWRLTHRPPSHPAATPARECHAAGAAHGLLLPPAARPPAHRLGLASLSPYSIPTVLLSPCPVTPLSDTWSTQP
jgi:cytochrome b561